MSKSHWLDETKTDMPYFNATDVLKKNCTTKCQMYKHKNSQKNKSLVLVFLGLEWG